MDEKQIKIDRNVVELLANSLKFPRPRYFHKLLDGLDTFLDDIHKLQDQYPDEMVPMSHKFIKFFNEYSIVETFPVPPDDKPNFDHTEL